MSWGVGEYEPDNRRIDWCEPTDDVGEAEPQRRKGGDIDPDRCMPLKRCCLCKHAVFSPW